MAQQTFTYPTSGSAFLLQGMTWTIADFVQMSTPAFGGKVRTYETPGSRITVVITYFPQTTNERLELRGWWGKAGQQKNRVTMYDFAAPTPRGGLTGSPLVKTLAAVGADAVVLKTMNGGLSRGDMIRLTDGLHTVTDPATPVANEATVNIAPAIRTAVAADSAVVWDRPTGTFMVAAAPDIPFEGSGPHPSFSVTLIEVG
jgi:hypothetical protein